jgi:hypothetical protein
MSGDTIILESIPWRAEDAFTRKEIIIALKRGLVLGEGAFKASLALEERRSWR